MKTFLMILLAMVGFVLETGAKTQVSLGQIQSPLASGAMVNVAGKGWTLAVFDASMVLDTTTTPPTVRAVGGVQPVFVDWVIPAGTIDGTNAAFTLPSAPNPASSLTLIRNGVVLTMSQDYTLAASTVTFLAGAAPTPGDALAASYRH